MDSDHEKAQRRYSKEEARVIFQRSVRDGAMIFTKEARKRIRERKVHVEGDDADTNELLTLARTGVVRMEPEPHPKTGAWIYRMESHRTPVSVPFEIIDEKRVRLITVLKD